MVRADGTGEVLLTKYVDAVADVVANEGEGRWRRVIIRRLCLKSEVHIQCSADIVVSSLSLEEPPRSYLETGSAQKGARCQGWQSRPPEEKRDVGHVMRQKVVALT